MLETTLAGIDSRLDFVIAFQPLIAAHARQPIAWHALATAPNGRSFAAVAAAVSPEQRPALEASRIALAIEAAVRAGIRESDALLILPIGAAGGRAEALLGHLFRTALAWHFPVDRLLVEINADERGDLGCATALAQACTARGIGLALDGFAAGPVALNLLARFTPLFITLDPALIQNIHQSLSRRLIAEGVMRLARGLGVAVVARGATAAGESAVLDAIGVRHFQLDIAALPPAPRPRREPRLAIPVQRRAPAPFAAMAARGPAASMARAAA
ncbi:EAL domain-containing protein [Sphingomonas sp. CJ20]